MVFLSAIFIALSILAVSAADDEDVVPDSDSRFIFLPESEVHSDAFGMLMTCPSHKYGPRTQALEKMKQLLRDWPRRRTTSIWVCRNNTLFALRTFSSYVDRVVVNPFVKGG